MQSRDSLVRIYGEPWADIIALKERIPKLDFEISQGHVHCRSSKKVDDSTFKVFGRCPSLIEVVANGTSVTDQGLAAISSLPKLAGLHLGYTEVSDKGLSHLLGLPLQVLDLCGTRVTDAGLLSLVEIRTLEELWIIDCNCSEQAMREFQAELGECNLVASARTQ